MISLLECLWLRCVLRAIPALAVSILYAHFAHAGVPAGGYAGPPEKLHVYLLIGGDYMAGPSELAPEDAEVIDRCYLLNDKGEWEPAGEPLNRYSTIIHEDEPQKLGPGSGFVEAMLAADKEISIGLVVNAGGGSRNYIEHWRYKDPVYRAARERLRQACKIRNADKILFATDAGWWSFGKTDSREIQFQLFEELVLPDDVKEKIYHKNAEKLFGWD